jgi:hypothetical protein
MLADSLQSWSMWWPSSNIVAKRCCCWPILRDTLVTPAYHRQQGVAVQRRSHQGCTMYLKKILAGATIAGTLGFAALGLGPGVVSASPASADNISSAMWQDSGLG